MGITYLAASSETFETNFTLIGFLAGVQAHVQSKSFLNWKRFTAIVAGVRLRGAMLRCNMIFKASTLPELLAAVFTFKWPLIGMNANMLAQVIAT